MACDGVEHPYDETPRPGGAFSLLRRCLTGRIGADALGWACGPGIVWIAAAAGRAVR